MYLAFGFIFGMIIREVLYVPRNFWQGIIIITGMSNWSNLREQEFMLSFAPTQGYI
jgi:hypothetical protein